MICFLPNPFDLCYDLLRILLHLFRFSTQLPFVYLQFQNSVLATSPSSTVRTSSNALATFSATISNLFRVQVALGTLTWIIPTTCAWIYAWSNLAVILRASDLQFIHETVVSIRIFAFIGFNPNLHFHFQIQITASVSIITFRTPRSTNCCWPSTSIWVLFLNLCMKLSELYLLSILVLSTFIVLLKLNVLLFQLIHLGCKNLVIFGYPCDFTLLLIQNSLEFNLHFGFHVTMFFFHF